MDLCSPRPKLDLINFFSFAHLCLIGVLLTCTSLHPIQGAEVEDSIDTLRLVHILYRHGDRAPISFYPNDPFKNVSHIYWPEGLGQLSKKGKAMEYALGMWLRKRYSSFINSVFDPEEMNIISTDYDRTLMSAQCVLASFYYPDNETRFNNHLSWMPTPVHTFPMETDKLLNVDSACPRVSLETNKMQALHEIRAYLDSHKEFFHFLSQKTGEKLNTVLAVDYLFDTLKIERLYNLTLPDWALEKYDDMKKVADFSFVMHSYTRELKRLRGGPLVGLISNNMHKKAHGELSERKMLMFSAHDTTVATILDTLGVFNKKAPPYAATVLVELHQQGHKYFVKAFYQNDSSLVSDPHPLVIPGCTEECPVEEWAKLLNDVTPKDWDRECYRPDPVRDHYFIMASTGLSCVFGSILVFLVGWLMFRNRCYCRFTRTRESRDPLTRVIVATPDYGSFDSRDGSIRWSGQPRSL